MSVDHYKTLGLKHDCSKEEIEDAYHSLVRKWHPDSNRDQQKKATLMFNRVTKAYQYLCNTDDRHKYDVEMGYKRSGMPLGMSGTRIITYSTDGNGAQRLIQQLFGQPVSVANTGAETVPTSASTENKKPQKPHIVRKINLSLEDIYHGCEKRLEKITLDGKEKLVTIPIPRGCPETEVITIVKGEHTIDFKVAPKPHHVFTRKGYDLYMNHTIPLKEFVNGFEIYVTTLDSKRKRIRQRRGGSVISSVDPIKVKGLGMPIGNSGTFGDLYIELSVTLPDVY